MAEVSARLERFALSPEAIMDAVAELIELGYLDDARFARVFAEDRRHLDAWGAERIARTLEERGIDRELIAAVVEAEPADAERDRALAILARRFPDPPRDPRDHRRALGVLVRKGYDSEVAYDVVRAWAAGSDNAAAPIVRAAETAPGRATGGGRATGLGHLGPLRPKRGGTTMGGSD